LVTRRRAPIAFASSEYDRRSLYFGPPPAAAIPSRCAHLTWLPSAVVESPVRAFSGATEGRFVFGGPVERDAVCSYAVWADSAVGYA
jgi:hypothetical protein